MPSSEKAQNRQHSGAEVEVDVPAVGAKATMAPSAATPSAQRDPLLSTKLHQPRPRSRLVSRSHLIERLQQGMECALTLISASAGFGKTTLLAQWLAESNTPAVWLSLEPEDNDHFRFLTYLIAAFQMQYPHLDMNVLALLEAPQSAPLERALAVLTNDLMNRQVGDFALVLDDYHVITAEPIHHAMAFLLDHLPPQMHLVPLTRADPPLPLSRLRARGQLIELRAAELRLSTSETETFLHTVMGLDLPSEAVAALERRTEGWVAGLQLAALSLCVAGLMSRHFWLPSPAAIASCWIIFPRKCFPVSLLRFSRFCSTPQSWSVSPARSVTRLLSKKAARSCWKPLNI